ncbi:MAG: endonuclease [Candidatus Aenigmatarchaeota archaeon]|nr:endonuclease [Candidatus Aenigmarchaeota archaeon]
MQPSMIYTALRRQYGSNHSWWPAKSRFEVIVGAILTQNTAWRNVEAAISNLRKAKMLDISKISQADLATLKRLVRPAGFYNQKAKRLRDISRHLMAKWDGNLDRFFNRPVWQIRDELLELNGIGPETADSILLYAGNKPVLPVDTYTFRIINRLSKSNFRKYEELQGYFYKNICHNSRLFKELHALLVEHAKTTCKTKPICRQCVLAGACASRKL